MADISLKKLLTKILGPLKMIFAKLDAVKMGDNSLQNNFSIYKVTRVAYKARSNDGTDEAKDMQNANHRIGKNRTDENDTRIKGEFPVQQIVKHVGSGRKMK